MAIALQQAMAEVASSPLSKELRGAGIGENSFVMRWGSAGVGKSRLSQAALLRIHAASAGSSASGVPPEKS